MLRFLKTELKEEISRRRSEGLTGASAAPPSPASEGLGTGLAAPWASPGVVKGL